MGRYLKQSSATFKTKFDVRPSTSPMNTPRSIPTNDDVVVAFAIAPQGVHSVIDPPEPWTRTSPSIAFEAAGERGCTEAQRHILITEFVSSREPALQ